MIERQFWYPTATCHKVDKDSFQLRLQVVATHSRTWSNKSERKEGFLYAWGDFLWEQRH